jgi:hypothetical protein
MATPTRRGRPRDPQVIDRDDTVYKLIVAEPRSRSELAELTGHDRPTIALSCQRLKQAARIRPCYVGGRTVWAVDDGTPCP